MTRILLASTSPRRRELLEQIGVPYGLVEGDVCETLHPGESPEVYVLRLALAKATAARANVAQDALVLAADTTVVLGGEVLGKPLDRADALAMLGRLSGRTHHVYTGVALAGPSGAQTRLSVSAVTFRAIAPAEREAYWATGEPVDKAGGYGIQGKGAVFVERIEGSYSGVMGLPLFETAELLQHFGYLPAAFWQRPGSGA